MMVLHKNADACYVTQAQVRKVPVPKPDGRWFLVGHGIMIDMVQKELKRRKITITANKFALAKQNAQFFGIFDVKVPGITEADFGLAVGVRSSIDKSLANGLCLGSRVFVCDNLAFSGEVVFKRRNTINIMGELPGMVSAAFDRCASLAQHQAKLFTALKGTELKGKDAEHFVIEAAKAKIIPSCGILPVLELWDDPTILAENKTETTALTKAFPEGAAWRLFNGFTAYMKRAFDQNAVVAEQQTRRLTALFAGQLVD